MQLLITNFITFKIPILTTNIILYTTAVKIGILNAIEFITNIFILLHSDLKCNKFINYLQSSCLISFYDPTCRYIYIITQQRGVCLIYVHDAQGHAAPKGEYIYIRQILTCYVITNIHISHSVLAHFSLFSSLRC